MDPVRNNEISWRTAVTCESGACVEVAATENTILIGSSRQHGGPVLEYTPDEWHAFVEGIKQGDFDDLVA